MVIAMDGPASAGKSTLAVKTAEALNFRFLNTGMIFRAIAYLLDKQNVDFDDENTIQQIINKSKIQVKFINDEQNVFVDNENTINYVSLPSIAEKASLFSQKLLIRNKVKEIQHDFAKEYNVVIEGRDIGTEIFPNAEYKFFITASIEERAKRRFETLSKTDKSIRIEQIKKQLEERDYNDSHRKISPLRKADDAIIIDTSNDTIEDSLNKIINYIKK